MTSETFYKLLAALRDGGGPVDNLLAWLYRVAHNVVVDGYRRQPDDAPLSLDQAPEIPVAARQEKLLERRERVAQARHALRQLTTLRQQVISLRFLEELSIKETAEAMDKREGAPRLVSHTQRSRGRRARKL